MVLAKSGDGKGDEPQVLDQYSLVGQEVLGARGSWSMRGYARSVGGMGGS